MDYSTPNLPSRDFTKTQEFYAAIGFEVDFRNEAWMILKRGSMTLEFFPHPDLDPYESWFSCCLRLGDVQAFFTECRRAGIPEKKKDFPRVQAPTKNGELLIGGLLDPDGTLLRFIQTR